MASATDIMALHDKTMEWLQGSHAEAPRMARRLLALASPGAEALSDKQRIDEFVDAAIEAAGELIRHAELQPPPSSDDKIAMDRDRWRRVAERLETEKPALDKTVAEPPPRPSPESKPVEWLWWGCDELGVEHMSFGRWHKHPCQHRYKYAKPQTTEHDHPISTAALPTADALTATERQMRNAPMTKPESMLEIAAMCHREKWQFGESLAFDVLHRIGDLARAKAEIAREQARWANDVVVTATGVFPQNYVVRSPCDPPLPKPDFLYIEGTVYRKESAKTPEEKVREMEDRKQIDSLAKRCNDFNDQVNELRSRRDDMLAAFKAIRHRAAADSDLYQSVGHLSLANSLSFIAETADAAIAKAEAVS
ncbi:hypothetical protein [Mesorhizobium wenxiniae]|nr:hypothetical protein [Mesorhizobium wenxiniae]